jgi:syntaxin 1B/2/3
MSYDDDGERMPLLAQRPEGAEDEFLNPFFQEVNHIKETIARIESNLKQMKATRQQEYDDIDGDGGSAAKLQKLMKNTNWLANLVRGRLKRMHAENQQLERTNDTEARVRINMHNVLTKKFVRVMEEFQSLLAGMKNAQTQKISRQCKIGMC